MVDMMLTSYQSQGAATFDARAGYQLWHRSFGPDPEGGYDRVCTSCHGSDLRKPGIHRQTGKVIDPMAPSVNPQRLTDPAKIEKWFLRNCKQVLGRECSPQEKGNFLLYLKDQ
ncbi:MAG: DUF1924 domain-containing protein [Magnetococcales bacterium]|nr:DUF1924 domain-containing protein [Magnetococcales bacterium]